MRTVVYYTVISIWWIVAKLGYAVAVLVWSVTTWLVVFALCVRGHTLVSEEKPHLSSFDPQKREAAANAAARDYGVQP